MGPLVSERVSLVVSLWIRDNDVAGFEAFERAAAAIMSKHGGLVETVVRCSGEGDPFEVHVVSFPSAAAFQEYRDDPRLTELRPLRDRSIARTEVWRGMQRQPYGLPQSLAES